MSDLKRVLGQAAQETFFWGSFIGLYLGYPGFGIAVQIFGWFTVVLSFFIFLSFVVSEQKTSDLELNDKLKIIREGIDTLFRTTTSNWKLYSVITGLLEACAFAYFGFNFLAFFYTIAIFMLGHVSSICIARRETTKIEIIKV